MKIVKDHGMARQGAKDTVDALLPNLIQRHGDSMSNPKGAWSGDVFEFSFVARGFSIKGTLEVNDSQLILDAKLPFLAKPFEGMIRSRIEQELDHILSK